MYRIRTPKDTGAMIRRLTYAIRREVPVTLTYAKAEGEVTVRTVEPYEVILTAPGYALLRTLDRESGTFRSWRLDRILFYTVHKGAKNVLVVEEKEEV